MRVKCLAQEHNTMARTGLEPGPLHPESSALTTRPPRLPFSSTKRPIKHQFKEENISGRSKTLSSLPHIVIKYERVTCKVCVKLALFSFKIYDILTFYFLFFL